MFKQYDNFSWALGRPILANMVKTGRNEQVRSSSKNPGRRDGTGNCSSKKQMGNREKNEKAPKVFRTWMVRIIN